MTPEETFGQLLGLGKAWRVVEARLESGSSTLVLKVESGLRCGRSLETPRSSDRSRFGCGANGAGCHASMSILRFGVVRKPYCPPHGNFTNEASFLRSVFELPA